MKQYKYVLFDWDGTIANTSSLWPDIFGEILDEQGIKLNRRQVIEACAGMVDYLIKNTSLSEAESKEILEEGLKRASFKLPDMGLFSGAKDMLHELRQQGKILALITSSRRAVLKPLFQKSGLQGIFDTEVCVEDTENAKPHPEPLLKALELIGGQPEESIMIGDTPHDIIAANEAKVDSILFYPKEHEEFYILDDVLKHEPNHVIKDLSEIIKIAS